MSGTIKSWSAAAKARDPKGCERIARLLTVGTVEGPEAIRVVWLGEHIALVAWSFGAKEVVVVARPRHETQADSAARHRLVPEALHLDRRITGSALDKLITKLSQADEIWSAVVKEEAAKLDHAYAPPPPHLDKTTKAPTAAAVSSAEAKERWYYDLDTRTVRDENGLVVIAARSDQQSNTELEKIAAAPHALSLVSRLSRLLSVVVNGEDGPLWKDRARELLREANALVADPGSSACIVDENADTFVKGG